MSIDDKQRRQLLELASLILAKGESLHYESLRGHRYRKCQWYQEEGWAGQDCDRRWFGDYLSWVHDEISQVLTKESAADLPEPRGQALSVPSGTELVDLSGEGGLATPPLRKWSIEWVLSRLSF